MRENIEFVDRRGTGSLKWDTLERRYGRGDLLSMWVADMDFRCPACVQEALRRYMDCGAYGYSALDRRFLEAFIQWERKRHGYEPEMSWLRYAPGVVPAFHWCVLTMTEPGDSVLVLPPVYYPFYDAVESTGRQMVQSQLIWDGQSFLMDFSDIEQKIIDHSARMLLFCSPHNPVGRVWRREELERLMDICARHRVTVISDEIHQDFVFGKAVHTPLATVGKGEVVTLTAPSKSFNLAGLQNAVVIIPAEELRERWDRLMKKLRITSGNSFGYLAGEAAYLNGGGWLEQVKEIIYGNYLYLRETLLTAYPKIVVAPLEGTYLMWVDFGGYLAKWELENFFEKTCGIALDYGSWFRGGADTWVRFNLATSREIIEQAGERIIKAMAAR